MLHIAIYIYMNENIDLDKPDENIGLGEYTKKKLSRKAIVKEIIEWVLCFVIAYIIYLNINYFLGTISGVRQVSMLPTAVQGERLLIQRPTIFKRELKQGDIITFEAPMNIRVGDTSDVMAKYEEYKGLNKFFYSFVGIGQKSYIKRIIGISGDHIEIRENGKVYRNDIELNESYLRDGKTNLNGPYMDVVVPNDCIFVMGDNRLQSNDSRTFGCIPIDKVNGYVIIRVWPFNKFGRLQ